LIDRLINLLINKYERYYWTRKAPTCLLILLCHYGKPRIHHYAPPIGWSVTHRAATSLAAAGLYSVSEVPVKRTLLITQRIRGFLNDMRYINSRFTYLLYLLTYLLTH